MTIHFDDTIHITPVPDGVSKQEFDQEVGRLDDRIDVVEASSDVTDVVGTYSDLENYDTSTLTDNDIIKVLEDSTHDGAISYYRWSTTSESFTFIGSLGPYPTQDYVDNTFSNKSLSNLSSDGNSRLHALKGYADAGELLTDTEGLADVRSYAHSTFDLSKFTVVGTPNITDDGIVSGFSTSNYLTIPDLHLENADSWKFTSLVNINSYEAYNGGTIISPASGNGLMLPCASGNGTNVTFQLYLSSSSSSWDIANGTSVQFEYNPAHWYKVTLEFTGTRYLYTVLNLNTNESKSVPPISSTTKIYQTPTRIGVKRYEAKLLGQVDLKHFSIEIDGVPAFSGNETGTDNYTINGSTVAIPYTLSKTGSKIVDSAYRTQVASVYNEFGYAPYYTLSDSDFTLPQGELYGMIAKASGNGSEITVDQTYDATSANPQSGTAVAEAVATVDLSAYATTSEVQEAVSKKQNILSPSEPLSITETIINNLQNLTYTAGNTGVYSNNASTNGYPNAKLESAPENYIAMSRYTSSGQDNVTCPLNEENFWSVGYIDIPYSLGQIVGGGRASVSGAGSYETGNIIFGKYANNSFIPIATSYSTNSGRYWVVYTSDTSSYGSVSGQGANIFWIPAVAGTRVSIATGTVANIGEEYNRSYYGSLAQIIDNETSISIHMGAGRYFFTCTTADASLYLRLKEITVARVVPTRAKGNLSNYPLLTNSVGLWNSETALTSSVFSASENILGTNLFDISGATTVTALNLGIGSGLAVQGGNLVNTNPPIVTTTSTDYGQLTPDNSTLYIITDTGAIYLGTTLIAQKNS